MFSVWGLSRVPRPAARINAFIYIMPGLRGSGFNPACHCEARAGRVPGWKTPDDLLSKTISVGMNCIRIEQYLIVIIRTPYAVI